MRQHSKALNWQAATLLALLLLAAALWLFAGILGSLLTAWLLAWLLAPLVGRLERRGWSRNGAVLLIFVLGGLLLLGLLLLLLPLLLEQMRALLATLPSALGELERQFWPRLAPLFGLDPAQLPGLFDWLKEQLRAIPAKEWQPVALWSGHALGSLLALLLALLQLLMIPLFAFYLLHDWQALHTAIRRHLPSRLRPTLLRLADEATLMVGHYLRGQLLLCLIEGVLYSIGLLLLGIPHALAIGMAAGLLIFIPYVGLLFALAAALLVALFNFGVDYHLVLLLALFAGMQLLDGLILAPRILGEQLGLHPLVILLALIVAGDRFGFVGMLLAVPATAIAVVILRELDRRYRDSRLFDHH